MVLYSIVNLLLHLILSSYSVHSLYTITNVSTTWTNDPKSLTLLSFDDGSMVRLVYSAKSSGPTFALGFYSSGDCNSFLLALFVYNPSALWGDPRVIWSGNRNIPVRDNSVLNFTVEGDLILRDVDGTIAWSTYTKGRSVVGLSLTEMGNLVLSDQHNRIIWESYDHPTDTLVPGQKLVQGQMLIASASETNWSSGMHSLSVTSNGMIASYESTPRIPYYETSVHLNKHHNMPRYVQFLNGSLDLYINNVEPKHPDKKFSIPLASSIQILILGSDGHLRVFDWALVWGKVADLFSYQVDDCYYPMSCGKYGICLNGKCSCPEVTKDGVQFFRPVDTSQPDLGCFPVTPLSCTTPRHHRLLELKGTTYFSLGDPFSIQDTESCKMMCLKNCSCGAVIIYNKLNFKSGLCYFKSDIVSFINVSDRQPEFLAYVKVQIAHINSSAQPSPARIHPSPLATKFDLDLRTLAFGTLVGVCVSIFCLVLLRKNKVPENDEKYLDMLPGIPTRYSYKELKHATESFCRKIGEGGYGAVYEGSLVDGTKIAVKCLEGLSQVKRSFFAEVEAIGSTRHVNLVSLIGFCAEKSRRLLVYEYMCNGSLDTWIFYRNKGALLDWETIKKIILDIAKGLTYLHEECPKRILHLDVKPQNILLDDKFNAKVSDFGLSKLVSRGQSKVMTTLKGTIGYLAPEWLSSVITEKVDVYSFGIVVIETLCRRRNLDLTLPEECMHLLTIFEKYIKANQLGEMADNYCNGLESHRDEVIEMLKLAAWCLQADPVKRPSMSTVVKVLEGVIDIEQNLSYNFFTTLLHVTTSIPTILISSVLSGPR